MTIAFKSRHMHRLLTYRFLLLIGCIVSLGTPLDNEGLAANILVTEIQALGVTAQERVELTSDLRRQIAKLPGVKTHLFVSQTKDSDNWLKNCLANISCREDLATKRKTSHILVSRIHGLGSTFTISLRLYDLRNDKLMKFIVNQQGKRSHQTFSEALSLAVEKLREKMDTAGLLKKQPALVVSKPKMSTAIDTTLPAQSPPTIPLLSAAPQKASHNQDSRQKKAWYQQWWVWTVVGGVAAGATTLAVMSSGSGGSGTTGTTITDGPPPPAGGGGGSTTISTTVNLR